MEQQHNIRIFETALDLSQNTCRFIVATAKQAIAERGQFVWALSGGRTPDQLFTLLSQQAFRKEMPWDKTYVFWGDERCVGLDDEQNNAHRAKELLLNHVAIPPSHVFPIPVDRPPNKAATTYENTLKSFFQSAPPRFDLILLGLGTNGHTASLFPGSAVLEEQVRWVAPVYVSEEDRFRITMTLPLINQARHIVFLVEGAEKASIFHALFQHTPEPTPYPAQRVHPTKGQLYWFADRAASRLFK